MIKLSPQIVAQLSNEDLEEILATSRNQKIIKIAQKELDSRKALKISRPLTIEDFLG